jgi:hypothetical protein
MKMCTTLSYLKIIIRVHGHNFGRGLGLSPIAHIPPRRLVPQNDLNLMNLLMAPFIYTPLKNSKTEIRLFELFPGRGQLQGLLSHCDLDTVKGTYDALSYCWGEQTKTVVININDCTLSIGKNLYAALKSIRRLQGRLRIWVDALCINQDDTQEKNAQVPFMKDIFFNGRRTFAWLGLDDIFTSLAFKEMKMVARWERKHGDRAEVGWRQWRKMHMEEDDMDVFTRIMGSLDLLDWSRRSILVRPWFSRCWVVQEIATSKAVTIICGKYHIDWSDMETAFKVFLESDDETHALISIRHRFHNSDTNHLETLLWRTNTFQTTDPRDRIFSLLGLVSQDSEMASDGPQGSAGDMIRVDYGVSIRDVYIEATMQCLIRTGSTGILSASLGPRRTNIKGLPSWILNPEPFLEDIQGNSSFAWKFAGLDSRTQTGGWTAAGSSMCDPQFDKQNILLGLQGIIVDIVDLVGAEREAVTESPKVVRLRGMVEHVKMGAGNIKCYLQWRAFSGVGGEKFYRGTTKTAEQAFYEIMCPRMPTTEENDWLVAEKHWDLCRRFDQFVTSTFGFMEQKIHGKLRKGELARIVSKCAQVVGEATFGNRADVTAAADFEGNNRLSVRRRFLRTRNGYIGLGGRDAEIGDNVVLLAGSAAPFLIRPASSGRYRIVSDAYFVGMMNGELWDSQRCGTIWLE